MRRTLRGDDQRELLGYVRHRSHRHDSHSTELKLTASWPLDWLQAPTLLKFNGNFPRMKRWSLRQDPFSEWKLPAIEDFGQICKLATAL